MPRPRPALLALAVTAAAAAACGSLELPIDTTNKVMVIVGARDLHPGVVIEEGDLYALEIPAGLLPNGVYLSPEHVVGRIPRERILANEFIRAERLGDPETSRGLIAILPRGMRAVAVPGGGMVVAPMSTVDVWRTDDPPCILVPSAFVLAVNAPLRSGPAAADTLSLLVAPADMGPLLQAAASGSLRMALRADDDMTENPELACSR